LFVIALTSLIILALLALLVIGLHRHQLSIAQHNADKYNPLPPLENITLNRELPDLPFDALGDQPVTTDENPGVSDTADEQHSATERTADTGKHLDAEDEDTEITVPQTAPPAVLVEHSDSELIPADSQNQAVPDPEQSSGGCDAPDHPPVESASVESSVDAESWQEQIAELKKQDRYDEALRICRQEYPLWSAYQQASLIHRARIKQLSQANHDITEELTSLYQLAAIASFLHDRVRGLPNLSLAQLKLLDLSWISALDMPYRQIGYTELRLIKKTDIKLLLEKWGRPQAHISPRQLHPDAWKRLCGGSQSTLY
jgi:hypothetical protein